MSSKNAPDAAVPLRRPWSLAGRLTAWYAGSSFAVVAVATGLLYWGLVANLDSEDDEELADKVRILRGVLRDRPDDLTGLRQQAEWGWAARQYAQVHVRVLDDQGRVLLETPGMGQALPPAAFPPPLGPDDEPTRGGKDIRSGEGKPFRVLAAQAGTGTAGQPVRVVQVALDRTPEEELLEKYRRSLWVVLGLALVVCTLGGYRIARRGLRPVREVAATAARIRPANLGERLPTACPPSFWSWRAPSTPCSTAWRSRSAAWPPSRRPSPTSCARRSTTFAARPRWRWASRARPRSTAMPSVPAWRSAAGCRG
jgi:two-component system heavy metal sensor histidine kinase CusS